MRGLGELLERAPGAADGEGRAESPEYGADDDGALKFIFLFRDVEADDDQRGDGGNSRKQGQNVDAESSRMEVLEGPFCVDDDAEGNEGRGEKAADEMYSRNRCGSCHDMVPFHKDKFTLRNR